MHLDTNYRGRLVLRRSASSVAGRPGVGRDGTSSPSRTNAHGAAGYALPIWRPAYMKEGDERAGGPFERTFRGPDRPFVLRRELISRQGPVAGGGPTRPRQSALVPLRASVTVPRLKTGRPRERVSPMNNILEEWRRAGTTRGGVADSSPACARPGPVRRVFIIPLFLNAAVAIAKAPTVTPPTRCPVGTDRSPFDPLMRLGKVLGALRGCTGPPVPADEANLSTARRKTRSSAGSGIGVLIVTGMFEFAVGAVESRGADIGTAPDRAWRVVIAAIGCPLSPPHEPSKAGHGSWQPPQCFY